MDILTVVPWLFTAIFGLVAVVLAIDAVSTKRVHLANIILSQTAIRIVDIAAPEAWKVLQGSMRAKPTRFHLRVSWLMKIELFSSRDIPNTPPLGEEEYFCLSTTSARSPLTREAAMTISSRDNPSIHEWLKEHFDRIASTYDKNASERRKTA
jgi:hypothetical protein